MSGERGDGGERKVQWKSVYPSWYPAPFLSQKELAYLFLIERIFRVKYPDGRFDYIRLTNHQADFHKDDLAVKGYKAKNSVVVKSRGTSFTTNAIIRMLMSVYEYRDQIPPVIRINDTKVKELVESDFAEIIRNMTPVKIVGKDGGVDYIPFNNQMVDITAHEIFIPDRNVRITGYPSGASSSENIRGNRINFGMIDEGNFIINFQNVDTALIDASRGAALSGPNKGEVAFQATYGTTRKGRYTSFNMWLENIERLIVSKRLDRFEILRWPALDPDKVDLNRPLTEQVGLVPIAPWQTLEKLEERRVQNLNKFKEEYMAMLVDDKEKLYDLQLIQTLLLNEKVRSEKFIVERGSWWIGVDPAYSGDFFAISIFNKKVRAGSNKEEYVQTYLFYERGVDLTEMQGVCEDLIEHYMPLGLEMMSIDGNGLGVQLSNYLRKLYPAHVRVFRGSRVKVGGKNAGTISIKEYLHTNQIDLQHHKSVRYLADPVQLMHFSGWNQKYEFDVVEGAEANDMAHGDTTVSNGLALLPKNLNVLRGSYGPVVIGNTLTVKEGVKGVTVVDENDDGMSESQRLDRLEEKNKQEQEGFRTITLEDKLKMFKRTKFGGRGF